ncbi:sn1-specific diacylglycerol lipase alpha isoform x1 [Lasius niger]|uniref:Sn1-specific diacylglycerol lipase alpha isoform x1 n=1 Tax=Lasius niger TaxID=67767 RepID=A0A0J7P0R8_LASNI|nr:sn1-specific diacylglycerol lipase alpha isoform x1 [Lasius niger]
MLSKREPVYQALWADPCDFDEVLISPVMIQDHMPDNMLHALNKVSQDAIARQQARRSQAPLSRTPSVKPGHYEPLEETTDGPDVPHEAVQRDRIIRNANQEAVLNGSDCARVRPSTSIVVDVEVHERRETLPETR